jgi:hypothetical protein
MADEKISPENLKMAVEITKAAVPMQSGSMISNPDQVAKFIEVVAKKLEALAR